MLCLAGLQLRSKDEAYKATLPLMMAQLEDVLATSTLGYEPTVATAMRDAAEALQKLRAAPNAPSGYSRSYKKELDKRGVDEAHGIGGQGEARGAPGPAVQCDRLRR